MISNDKLKEIDIKNCMCYYFDDIIRIAEFDLDDILIDKKSSYNILYKSQIDSDRFDIIDGFVRGETIGL